VRETGHSSRAMPRCTAGSSIYWGRA